MSGSMYILWPHRSLQRPLLWGWGFSPAAATATYFYSQTFWGFFSAVLEPRVAWSVLLPICSSQFICSQMWDRQLLPFLPSLPVATLPCILSALAAHFHPSCQFGWMLILYSFIVRLPYSLIFWQFWLFFVFKFVVVLLLVVWGGKVYQPMPPSWPEVSHSENILMICVIFICMIYINKSL